MHYIKKNIDNNSYIELNCNNRNRTIKWRIVRSDGTIYDCGVLYNKYGKRKRPR